MKKSIRQLVLVSFSASILALGAVAPIFATESTDNTEETTEMVEESSVEEETNQEMAENIEITDAQRGLEEAIKIFQEEYPDAEIESIEVDFETAEEDDENEADKYEILVRGFTANDDSYELEIEWTEGSVREQEFNEGWLNSNDDDETEEELDEAQERRVLDLDHLISLDEASEAALAHFGSGVIEEWKLSADTAEFWGLFGDVENENPVWTISIKEADDTDDTMETDVQVDGVTGEVINPEEANDNLGDQSEESIEETPEAASEETTVTE